MDDLHQALEQFATKFWLDPSQLTIESRRPIPGRLGGEEVRVRVRTSGHEPDCFVYVTDDNPDGK